MQAVLNLVWDHLLPAMGESALPADPAGAGVLADKLANLALLPPSGQATTPLAAQVTGQQYTVEANELGIKAVSLEFSDSLCTLTMQEATGEEQITAGYGEWHKGSTALFGEPARVVAASGIWTADDTFLLTARLYETPFVHTLTFRFSGDDLHIETDVNVTFLTQQQSLVAHRVAK